MTVIYGYCGDEDTRVLSNIWKHYNNAKVLNAFDSTYNEIKEAVSNESDILILCGHGSGEGLFGTTPLDMESGCFAIDANMVPFIKAEYVIGVWCHAKDFAKKYHVRGFFTSMYISNRSEALFYLHEEATVSNVEITKSEIKFCDTLNYLIATELYNIKNWPKRILEIIPPTNQVEIFNHNALEYIN